MDPNEYTKSFTSLGVHIYTSHVAIIYVPLWIKKDIRFIPNAALLLILSFKDNNPLVSHLLTNFITRERARIVNLTQQETQVAMIETMCVENQPEVGWLGGWLYPQPTRVQTPGLTSVCLIKAEYSVSGRRRSRR
jgi:hypothetical protein